MRIAPLRSMRCFVLLALFGCYDHHVVERPLDAGPPLPDCVSLESSRPVLFSRTPPHDATLGSIDTTPDGVVVAAFTSSNAPSEMDVSRWIMPLDPTTGEALLDDRVTVFGEPRGLTFASHSHVTYPPSGSGIAYTWSAGQGCLVRPVGEGGRILGEARRIADDACLGARYSPDGRLFMAFRTEGMTPQRAYVIELDDAFRERARVGPSRTIGDAFHWTWTVDDSGSVQVAYANRDLELFAGSWRDPEPTARRVEGSEVATLPRLLNVRGTVLLGWREGDAEDMRIAFARTDDLNVRPIDLRLHPRASWDFRGRGNELWVAYAEQGDHRDSRVAIARFDFDFVWRERIRVGEERFPTRVRLEPTRDGALVVYTGQRDDAEGGNQLFAAPVHCTFDL